MSTREAMRARRTGERARRPRGSDVSLAARRRRARKRRRAVLLLIASLALLVLIGPQIHRTMADQATQERPDQAVANQVVADQAIQARADRARAAAANQAKANQANQERADQAKADQANQERADQAKADQANQERADQARAEQAAAAIKKAKAALPRPGAEGLEPHLSQAFSRARTAALAAGLDLQINSGFRSATEQQRLYDAAIAKYGSPEKARHWVLPPAESDHVKGLAIDAGPPAAAAWLEKHGVGYGLCRRYLNEWWHFELLAPGVGQRCPALEPYAGG
jgi:D-alanyl-D-alanine carboxypeptidase